MQRKLRLKKLEPRIVGFGPSGDAYSEGYKDASEDVARLLDLLIESELDDLGLWFILPNNSFDRKKPVEIIREGNVDVILGKLGKK